MPSISAGVGPKARAQSRGSVSLGRDWWFWAGRVSAQPLLPTWRGLSGQTPALRPLAPGGVSHQRMPLLPPRCLLALSARIRAFLSSGCSPKAGQILLSGEEGEKVALGSEAGSPSMDFLQGLRVRGQWGSPTPVGVR